MTRIKVRDDRGIQVTARLFTGRGNLGLLTVFPVVVSRDGSVAPLAVKRQNRVSKAAGKRRSVNGEGWADRAKQHLLRTCPFDNNSSDEDVVAGPNLCTS